MINFKTYLEEAAGKGLTIFDIDETMFITKAKVHVVKNGKIVKKLDNQEFNTYKKKPGEDYDFGEFKNAEVFKRTSTPIARMINKVRVILKNATKAGSKVIIVTARPNFDNKKTDLNQSIKLTVTDSNGLKSQDTMIVNIINDEAPIANAGEDFIAPYNKYVQLDGSKSTDKDSEIIYNWSIISGDASFNKKETVKKSPKFKYPSEISEPLEFVALLKIHDTKSFCFSSDKVIITCLPNVDMADSTVLYEIVRASKAENRVYIDLNVTNKQLWPFDFAAFTLISVKDGNNKLGQIDPYKGKNTVKYGIENEESVGVELVYNFESSPEEVNIICKSTMAINADSVFFKQTF